MNPLYNCNDEAHASVNDDYPYGRMRCTIRFWLEFNEKKGFRFCSRTQNPKTLRWNAIKHSTYCRFAANLYFDEKGHVQWFGITEYSSADEALQFVKNFTQSNFKLLKPWAIMKAAYNNQCATHQVHFEINGVKQEWSKQEDEEHQKASDTWKEVLDLIRKSEQ